MSNNVSQFSGSMQKRCNYTANALELRLFCITGKPMN